jgi:hypothetical protein
VAGEIIPVGCKRGECSKRGWFKIAGYKAGDMGQRNIKGGRTGKRRGW